LLLDASDWTESAPPPPARRTDCELSVPLGVHPDGLAVWDLSRAPHLLVAGATGSGKSSLLRNLVASLPLGWCWRVVIIDPKELDFSPVRHEVEVAGLATAAAMLGSIADELARRKQRLAAAECDHWTAVPTGIIPIRPVLVVVDESADLFAGIGLSKADGQGVRDTIGLLARQGRACGVHVVAAFTRPDTDAIPGAVRDQFAARVALGPLSPDGARMMFGAQRVPALPVAGVGTGLALGLDGSQRLRRLRVPWATVDDVRRRHGLPGVVSSK
jgi:DNA segregation ATPase FtsK/SpoIIIE-like protein